MFFVGVTAEQLSSINPDLKPGKALDGVTILIPAGKLSSRDKEILGGIGTTYRLYPIRAGETLADIMSKRKITLSEMQALNPGVDLNGIKGGWVHTQPFELCMGGGRRLPRACHSLAASSPVSVQAHLARL